MDINNLPMWDGYEDHICCGDVDDERAVLEAQVDAYYAELALRAKSYPSCAEDDECGTHPRTECWTCKCHEAGAASIRLRELVDAV